MEKLTTELILGERKRDQLGKHITAAKRREELLGACDQSGLTQAEFALREGDQIPCVYFVGAGATRVGSSASLSRPTTPVRFAEKVNFQLPKRGTGVPPVIIQKRKPMGRMPMSV